MTSKSQKLEKGEQYHQKQEALNALNKTFEEFKPKNFEEKNQRLSAIQANLSADHFKRLERSLQKSVEDTQKIDEVARDRLRKSLIRDFQQ